MTSLHPEDEKLLTLARAAVGRTGAGSAAAVRDGMGRTYVAGAVELGSLRLTAVQAAVVAAVSSGAQQLEAVGLVGAEVREGDEAVLAELGDPPVHQGPVRGV